MFLCNHYSYNNINDSQFPQVDLFGISAFPVVSCLYFGHFTAYRVGKGEVRRLNSSQPFLPLAGRATERYVPGVAGT